MIRAAIDIGSQTIRLLVAECLPNGTLRPVLRDQRIVRLGELQQTAGKLQPAAIERAAACISNFVARARDRGADSITAAATACVRSASNTSAFIERIQAETGITVRVLSGSAEATLALTGIRSVIPPDDTAVLAVDIGGGSTELILSTAQPPPFVESLDLGVLTLSESFLKHDPPTAETIADCTAAVKHILENGSSVLARCCGIDEPVTIIGTAGTITTLAAMDLALDTYDPDTINAHVLHRGRIKALFERMCTLTSAQRSGLPGLEQGRAQVIIPGTIIVAALFEITGIEHLVVSDAGLIEGLLLEDHQT